VSLAHTFAALPEEEKLEPVRTSTDDPRIRLLNRLYARKRKELQDRKALRDGAETEQQAVRVCHSRLSSASRMAV
jgi:hypothetical protein